MEAVRVKLAEVCDRLDDIDGKIVALDAKLCNFAFQKMTKQQENALRRQLYREKKQKIASCRLPLPDVCVLNRDSRLKSKFAGWAKVGMRFAVKGGPTGGAQFVQWLVHEWNNNVYLKKPITFSGSSFRVWNGHARHGYGPIDLLHLYRKRKMHGMYLRNPGEQQDFSQRKFWEWGTNVLRPVLYIMKEYPDWAKVPQRFKDTCCLLVGGTAQMKVGEDYWDFRESLETINRMMPKVVHLWLPLLEAVATGIRAKEQRAIP
jgi:hypothetical protein